MQDELYLRTVLVVLSQTAFLRRVQLKKPEAPQEDGIRRNEAGL